MKWALAHKMKKMKLKFCGLNKEENIKQALEYNPDFVGFIFYERSPRYARDLLSADFVKSISGATKKVGVFVKASLETILATVKGYGLEYVQLHGEESVEFCNYIKTLGIGVIKVFSVDEDFDFSIV